jgi:hypothetical protein
MDSLLIKFFNNVNPASPLFSGWNCVARTVLVATTLANCSPYVVVAAMTD